MTAARMLPALMIALSLAAPALAQAPGKSLAARVEALEKENAALRDDVGRLQTLLTQTRRDMLTMQGARIGGGVGYVPGPAGTPTLQPNPLTSQQAQTNAAIQQQGTQQQLNNLQLQQNMIQDRQREQQLFQPAPFGGTP